MNDLANPEVNVLGVYRIEVTDELVLEQTEILYGDRRGSAREQCERDCREQLYSTVLVEVIVQGRDSRFRIADFGQAHMDQVAWAEAFLNLDGESLAVERWGDCPDIDPIRIAFFIHFWDPKEPLRTSYGPITCTEPRPMPARLAQLVPYVLLD